MTEEKKLIEYYCFDTERQLLGALILNASGIELVRPEYFYAPQHRAIFLAILKVIENNLEPTPRVIAPYLHHPISETTLRENFKQEMHLYIIGIIADVSFVESKKGLTNTLAHYYKQRLTEELHKQSLVKLEGTTPEQLNALITENKNKIEVIEQLDLSDEEQICDPLLHAQAFLDDLNDPKVIDMLPTGLTTLDHALSGGINTSSLMVIGARPSVGKTALAVDLMLRIAKQGHKVLFFSLEMTGKEIRRRIVSRETGIPINIIKERRIYADKIQKVTEVLCSPEIRNLLIYDKRPITASQIVSITKSLKRKHDIKAVFIDYVQKIEFESNYQSHTYNIQKITNTLQIFTKQLNIPVILLAQLNRDTQDNAPPRLTDLRDSGSLEQDADQILLLHRDSYGKPEIPFNNLQILIAKNKDGEIGQITLNVNPRTLNFN